MELFCSIRFTSRQCVPGGCGNDATQLFWKPSLRLLLVTCCGMIVHLPEPWPSRDRDTPKSIQQSLRKEAAVDIQTPASTLSFPPNYEVSGKVCKKGVGSGVYPSPQGSGRIPRFLQSKLSRIGATSRISDGLALGCNCSLESTTDCGVWFDSIWNAVAVSILFF